MERRKKRRFAVGHMALGYVLGKASSKSLRVDLNIPLALTLSVIPDIDILLEHLDSLGPIIPHRGPLHSFLASLIVFIPFFAVYRQKALPYFMALVQHSLIGDYLTGGQLQLLWPITQQKFGLAASIYSPQNIALEWNLFVMSFALMLITKDIALLFRNKLSNLVLAIPTFTVLLPAFLSVPLDVPALLIPPHLIYTIIFSAAIFVELFRLFVSVARTRAPFDQESVRTAR